MTFQKKEIDIIEVIKRFIDERRIEAAIPPYIRKRGVVLDLNDRLNGLTNQNYKVQVGGETLVLRMPGKGTDKFIDRSIERANQEAAALAGFTLPSIYFNDRSGVKITSFLHEARALTGVGVRQTAELTAVAGLLSHFHTSGILFVNDFNVFRLATHYERVARTKTGRMYDNFSAVKERIHHLEKPLLAFNVKKIACHNDLVPENILNTPEGLTLIDWEYSGMNDPAWDLASFFLESEFSPAEKLAFYELYTAFPITEQFQVRINAYQLLQDNLWAIWSLLQAASSKNAQTAASYYSYGKNRFERCLAALPEVEHQLGIK